MSGQSRARTKLQAAGLGPAPSSMTVAGLMSGTSADGIDVSIVKIRPRRNDLSLDLSLDLLGHAGFPFPRALREAVLAAMDAPAIATAELGRLNWRLGHAYTEALVETLKLFPHRLQLVGCHGQTIYHQPRGTRYAGRIVACTWQIGEMAMLAAEFGVPVVSNFRPADMVAGGQGAPLVPLLDFVLFRHATRGRVLQNLGGIGNLTALPPNAKPSQVLAFDTGPGNMVIDQLMQQLFEKKFDRNGEIAAKGTVLESVVSAMLRNRFFRASPPKSAGREEFGRGYAKQFHEACRRARGRPEDIIASATALTAKSVRLSYEIFVKAAMRRAPVDFIVSGGGAQNGTLLKMLRQELEPLGCIVTVSDKMGLPAQAKESAAFALLAYQTWHRRPGNVPAATGASRPAILGQITYV
jgi:anhydro-N-acetylmuramic acid kinase